MARVVVDVMLKPEILDPQGQAILASLPNLGIEGVAAIRQGKHFILDLDTEDADEARVIVDKLAGTLLSNPVIEDFEIRSGS